MIELERKKQEYKELLINTPTYIIDKIEMQFDIAFTHHSTAIEGNTLSLIETKLILEDGISIQGKELREIFEVVNHQKAFNYIKACIHDDKELNEAILKNVHELLTENIFQGGIYRMNNVIISGATHRPPSSNDMYNQLQVFYQELKDKSKKNNAIALAAWTHAEFVRIHPFNDGNGRTARLIMNYQLMKNGYPAILIKNTDKIEYYEALDEYAVSKNLERFKSIVYKGVDNQLDELIGLLNTNRK